MTQFSQTKQNITLIKRSVPLWYFLISFSAVVPGLYFLAYIVKSNSSFTYINLKPTIQFLKQTFNPWTEAFRDDFLDLLFLVMSFESWGLRAGWFDLSFLLFLAVKSVVVFWFFVTTGEPVKRAECSFGPSLKQNGKIRTCKIDFHVNM